MEQDAKSTPSWLENAETTTSPDQTSRQDDVHGDVEKARLTRQVLRKLDVRMLPMLMVMFLFSFLDRTSIGNAKILGLTHDLNLSDGQYLNCLAIFFAFYIASEVPSNFLVRKFSPRIWLGVLSGMWGITGMCMGFVRSYVGLLVVRAVLGLTEGGLLPGIVLYLSLMYPRRQIGLRLGIIYSGASLAGAFGGLLARGLEKIGPHTKLEGWRWIFIVEGIATFLLGLLAIWVLPRSLETAHFFDSQERAVALEIHGQGMVIHGDQDTNLESRESPARWRHLASAFFSVKTWLSGIAFMSMLVALFSFSLFIPSIVNGLGYSAVEAQFYSVPPYAVAAVLTLVAAFASDRLQLRGPLILFILPTSIAGYALISRSENNHVRYGALFLIAAGLYPGVPPMLVWLANNNAHPVTRGAAIALQLSIGNCAGFPATFVYQAKQAPYYRTAHTVVMSLLILSWCCVALKCIYLKWVNHRKDLGHFDKFAGCGDNRDPAIRYII